MKQLIIVFFIFFSGCCSEDGFAQKVIEQKNGLVFYTPFEIEFIAGSSEVTFENLAFCQASIKENEFAKLLVETRDIYPIGNARAKIIFRDNIYFISREGVVTDSRNTYILRNKEDFYKLIKGSLHVNPVNKNISKSEVNSCK